MTTFDRKTCPSCFNAMKIQIIKYVKILADNDIHLWSHHYVSRSKNGDVYIKIGKYEIRILESEYKIIEP